MPKNSKVLSLCKDGVKQTSEHLKTTLKKNSKKSELRSNYPQWLTFIDYLLYGRW